VSAAVVFLKTKLIITAYEKIPKTIKNTVFKYFKYNRTDRHSTEVVHCYFSRSVPLFRRTR